jgi:hypothetical protein
MAKWNRELARQSLTAAVRPQIAQQRRLPTIPELAKRIRERDPYHGPSSATMIREDRDRG